MSAPPLTVLQVAGIRRDYEAGVPPAVIALEMGVTVRQAWAAVKGRIKGRPMPLEPRRPLCMDDEEWDGWQAGNRVQPMQGQAGSPCEDCLPGFALEMRAVSRCDGIPTGVVDEDPPLPAIVRRRHARNRPSKARSEANRRAWAEGRQSRERLAETNRSPAMREARVVAMRRRWADPAFRARHVRMMRDIWRDPEYRARQAQVVRPGRPRIHGPGCYRGRRCDCGARSVA